MQRSHILTGLVGAIFAGIFASQVASCTLEQTGTVDEDTGDPCQTNDNCDDGNACTTETCPTDTLVCVYAKQESGVAPDMAQTPGDCKKISCGPGATESESEDIADFINDNNSCTKDACVNGVSTNELMADGSSCTQGTRTGTCNAGMCEVSCSPSMPCDDGNPCTDEFCNTGTSKCSYTNLDGIPTPGVTPVVGDCKLNFCQNGMDAVVFDDADVRDDMNPCTTDICTTGVPSNPNVMQRIPCVPGDKQVCDGNGSCVACVVADDCVDIVETECEKRSCVNNTCQIAYEGNGTLASPVLQSAGNCQKVVCNGMMPPISVADNADVPIDGNACTKDVCTNGVPSNPPEAKDLNCGGTQVCDGMGRCVGCTAPGQCPGTDDFCKTRTCSAMGVCGYSYTANGTDTPTGQTTGDCKVLECDGMGNVKTSVLQSDVPVDGNPCTQDNCSGGGNPSNPPTMINSSCNVNGGDACDGVGNCKKSNGRTCGGGTECVSTNCIDGVCCNNTCATLCMACNVMGSLGTCTAVPVGTDDGTCTGATQSCNGSNNCDFELGQPCAAGSACLSNNCVDGVCCNNACGSACQGCGVAGSIGTCTNLPAGTTDTAPTNLCVGSSQCDGMGVCKKVNGTSCTGGMGSQCLSGNCVDGVCCDTTCATDCMACNLSASMGTCSNVSMGNDDGGCMGATASCDGMGACKGELGATCMAAMSTYCFSGNCVDGYCCNTTCTGLCQSCKANDTGAANGTCSPVTTGTDPGGECSTDMQSSCMQNGFCDGAGACQKYSMGTSCGNQSCTGNTQTNASACNGTGTCVSGGTLDCTPYICGAMACKTSCTADADCTTGNYCNTMAMTCDPKRTNGQSCTATSQCVTGNFCIDGVCCATACLGQCQGCAVTGSIGTCSTLPLGTDDTNSTTTCAGTMTCNGMTMSPCRLKNGEMCTNNNQCASDKCPMPMPMTDPRICVP